MRIIDFYHTIGIGITLRLLIVDCTRLGPFEIIPFSKVDENIHYDGLFKEFRSKPRSLIYKNRDFRIEYDMDTDSYLIQSNFHYICHSLSLEESKIVAYDEELINKNCVWKRRQNETGYTFFVRFLNNELCLARDTNDIYLSHPLTLKICNSFDSNQRFILKPITSSVPKTSLNIKRTLFYK